MAHKQPTSQNDTPLRAHADLKDYAADLSVIKLGSAVVTTGIGHLDTAVLSEVAGFVSDQMDAGHSAIIVSSGAVAAGIGHLGREHRPTRVPELQALAAVGQGLLMDAWGEAFAAHGRKVAQVLVSADDFRDRRRYLNMRYTLEKLFEFGVVPIVNENDTITIDELRFGDNDGLAQILAIKMLAGMLVFLTRAEGVLDAQGGLVELIEKVDADALGLASDEKSTVGSGGMGSKLEAAREAAQAGIPVLIASGKRSGVLQGLFNGQGGGTLILPATGRRYSRRERFIAFSRVKPRGRIWVDAGAARALVEGKKSLLPAGITRTEGTYERQYVIEVLDPDNRVIARGLTNYNSDEVARIQGRRSGEIVGILGSHDYDEVIHRDNLVVLGEDG